MAYTLDRDGEVRLSGFVDRIGSVLGYRKRKECFATYAMGLLGDGERKSVEPIAARAMGDPTRVEAERQRLLHFIADSDWPDEKARSPTARSP